MLQNTLVQVLRAEPTHDGERELIERIRAVAMHCHGPLQVFLDKMRNKAGALGHFRKTRSLSEVGVRLSWSMITHKDVEDLRKLILSEMVAITVLLSMRQIAELKRVGLESKQIQAQSLEVLRIQNDAILQVVSGAPTAISEIRDLVSTVVLEQSQQTDFITQGLGNLAHRMRTLTMSSNRTFGVVRARAAQVNQGLARMASLLGDIQRLIQILAHCSREMSEALARNTYFLLNISRQMKRIVSAIEAIPLHLTLPIIRLDDALGESWGLPFQACTTWEAFNNLILGVVFTNGRTGTSLVMGGKFIITSAKTGQSLSPLTWNEAIKAGMHLHQAMIIEETTSVKGVCPHPACRGVLQSKFGNSTEQSCSNCGKWSMIRHQVLPHLELLD
ncbi:hypothetical protein BJX76DRAFT_24670 [Aspergillus varians]